MFRIQAHVTITGIVQGVGFRHSLWRRAIEKSLTGWVRNRRDGSVEALFQGDKSLIEDILEWCRSGPVHAKVYEVNVSWGNEEERFDSFTIRA